MSNVSLLSRLFLFALTSAACLSCSTSTHHAGAPATAADQPAVRALQLLSLTLHNRWMQREELAQVRRELATTQRSDQVYRSFLDRWLDFDAFRAVSARLVPGNPTVRSSFGAQLQLHRDPNGDLIYYLTHQKDLSSSSDMPCSRDEVVHVYPWWNIDKSVSICSTSYRADTIFDEVGYCGGQPEPATPLAPRPKCGCGPLLLGCLPPEEDRPGLVQEIDRDVRSEVIETAATIIAQGGTYRDLTTTTATWQTGLTRLLYLRRELIGELANHSFDDALEADMRKRISALDLRAEGAMIDRPPVYAGSGIFLFGLAAGLQDPGYRSIIRASLQRELCTADFSSVEVTSDVVLLTTTKTPNLRLKDVHESPMRTQEGCKGCHRPMDTTAGFLTAIATPLYGSMPTGNTNKATLVVNGSSDDRGSGIGPGDLMRRYTEQPEFEPCSYQRFFAAFVGRAPTQAELHEISQTMRKPSGSLRELFRTILSMDAFTRGLIVSEGS